jgi:hypothetical protein
MNLEDTAGDILIEYFFRRWNLEDVAGDILIAESCLVNAKSSPAVTSRKVSLYYGISFLHRNLLLQLPMFYSIPGHPLPSPLLVTRGPTAIRFRSPSVNPAPRDVHVPLRIAE